MDPAFRPLTELEAAESEVEDVPRTKPPRRLAVATAAGAFFALAVLALVGLNGGKTMPMANVRGAITAAEKAHVAMTLTNLTCLDIDDACKNAPDADACK